MGLLKLIAPPIARKIRRRCNRLQVVNFRSHRGVSRGVVKRVVQHHVIHVGCHPVDWLISFLCHSEFCVAFRVVVNMRTSSLYPLKRRSYVEQTPSGLIISLPPNTKDGVQVGFQEGGSAGKGHKE